MCLEARNSHLVEQTQIQNKNSHKIMNCMYRTYKKNPFAYSVGNFNIPALEDMIFTFRFLQKYSLEFSFFAYILNETKRRSVLCSPLLRVFPPFLTMTYIL